MDIEFSLVEDDASLDRVSALAREIWSEYFPPIIGTVQVAHMLETYQSRAAIEAAVAGGDRYVLIVADGQVSGYAAWRDEPDARFLSKLYLRAAARGHGIGRLVFQRIAAEAREQGARRLWLTVNRHNRMAIAAYHSYGMRISATRVADIGAGFVMDDYVMEMGLSRPSQ